LQIVRNLSQKTYNLNSKVKRWQLSAWLTLDRIRCFCSPRNIRWTTSIKNQNNKGGCIGKDEREHTNEDITYLEDWIQHVKLTKAKGKDNYLKKLDLILKN
jgi:hypothetical protein